MCCLTLEAASANLHYTAGAPVLRKVDGIYVINLKRRPDRLKTFLESSQFKASDVHVYEAVDGRALTLTDNIKTLFGNCDYKYHRGYISATLSHYGLWQHIAATHNELHLVLEDDAKFSKNFISSWNDRISHALPKNAELVYLGGILAENMWAYKDGSVLESINDHFSQHRLTQYFQHDFLEGVDNFTRGEPTRRFFYTSIAYLISSNAARSLVDHIRTFGFRKAADHTLYRLMAWTPRTYAVTPLPVTIPRRRDSDVQHEGNMLDDPAAACPAGQCNQQAGWHGAPKRATTRLGAIDVPTFVLTLEAGPDRSAAFKTSAREAGVSYAPFFGVDGKQVLPWAQSLYRGTPLSFNKASLMTCRHSRSQVDIAELQQSGVLGQDFPNLPGTAAVRPTPPPASLASPLHVAQISFGRRLLFCSATCTTSHASSRLHTTRHIHRTLNGPSSASQAGWPEPYYAAGAAAGGRCGAILPHLRG